MKNKSKFFTTVFLSVLSATLLTISVGFSALNQSLNISGDIDYDEHSIYLYDVLRKEAAKDNYAKEYTEEHKDSFTEAATKSIYYWYASDDAAATIIKNKWNVIFGNFCWQMYRTTDTGGVKMIYNGIPNDGKCNNSGVNSQIGTSRFSDNNTSLADVGFMYNDRKSSTKKQISEKETFYDQTNSYFSTSYMFSDNVIWDSTNRVWKLDNPYTVSSKNETRHKYTFYNSDPNYTYITVNYISGISGNLMMCLNLSNGETLSNKINTYTYGSSYIDNGNGTYTIESPTTFSTDEYDTNSTLISNKYICKNASNNTCNNIWQVVYHDGSSLVYIYSNNTYKYGNNVTYENGKYILSGNVRNIWNTSELDKKILNNYHYTCFNTSGQCNNVSYIHNLLYSASNSKNHVFLYYINLSNGEDIDEAKSKMIDADNVNLYDSAIKSIIETWYSNNLIDYTSYLEDTIYCNTRTTITDDGWLPNGGELETSLFFNGAYEFKCLKATDKFSVSNNKAKLQYPIGLPTYKEVTLMNNRNLKATSQEYWTISPRSYYVDPNDSSIFSTIWSVASSGFWNYRQTSYSLGVRPVISLKPGTRYASGTGSKETPYIINTSG